MISEHSRRRFLRNSAIAAAAGGVSFAGADSPAAGDIRLGVASYSFREFSRKLAIQGTKALKTPYLCIKEFHLLYRSTPEEIAKGRAEFEKAGITLTGGGTVYFLKEDESDVKFYFDYAKAAGLPMMVIGPTAKTLPIIEKYVKQYNIKVALHNHGPEDKHFPAPKDALNAVKNMDPRVGLCIDVGHTVRTGADVVAAINEAGPRLLDMHIKDLADLKVASSQCDVGEGAMPIPAIFKALKKINYAGIVHLEYEINADNPLPGMQKSFSYMRGVLAGQRG